MKHINRCVAVFFCISFLMETNVFADSAPDISIGRYLTVADAPATEQLYPLRQQRQVHFPANVTTIGDALSSWLQFSSYRLLSEEAMSESIASIMSLPLSESDRILGPLSLLKGIQALVGDTYIVVIDPVHRLISFELKPTYQVIYPVN